MNIGKGCNDYKNRPDLPCKVFQCEWLINESIPKDFKPSKSNTIILKRYTDKNTYFLSAGFSDQAGIVGGIDEDYNQIRCQASILVKGLGTITCNTGSSTVTGTGTHFTTDAFTGNTQLWVSDGAGG